MDAHNLAPSSESVKSVVAEATCSECKKLKSKRNALVTSVEFGETTKTVFCCAECCHELWANGYGWDRDSIEYFLQRVAVSTEFKKLAAERIQIYSGSVA